jgi:tRNA threonylcarbamoyl adenosine modification protein YeaZ
MILAFDTSSALSSVAVVADGAVLLERSHLDARRHAEVIGVLFAQVRSAIDPSALTAVVCGVGPGPYTGLRVGIAAALAAGAAWGRPVIGVCSLDAIALAALMSTDPPGLVSVATDARRSEVYWARYDGSGTRLEGPRVSRPGSIEAALRDGRWVGHGAALHAGLFTTVDVDVDDETPRAYATASWIGHRAAALLADGAVAADASEVLDAHGEDTGSTSRALAGAALLPPRPLYLRRPDAVAAGGAA